MTKLLESEVDDDERVFVASKKESRNRQRGFTVDARFTSSIYTDQ